MIILNGFLAIVNFSLGMIHYDMGNRKMAYACFIASALCTSVVVVGIMYV